MATVTRGYSFGATEEVTAAKLHSLVDAATVTGIVAADITAGVITDTQIEGVSGAKLTNLANIPGGSGLIPIANIPTISTAGKVTGAALADFTNIPSNAGVIPIANLFTAGWTDYSSTATVVGWSSTTTKEIIYCKIGRLVFVRFYIVGTSNSTTTTFTLPYTSANRSGLTGAVMLDVVDNSSRVTSPARVYIGNNTSTVTCDKDLNSGAWTASNSKSVQGNFFYEAIS